MKRYSVFPHVCTLKCFQRANTPMPKCSSIMMTPKTKNRNQNQNQNQDQNACMTAISCR